MTSLFTSNILVPNLPFLSAEKYTVSYLYFTISSLISLIQSSIKVFTSSDNSSKPPCDRVQIKNLIFYLLI